MSDGGAGQHPGQPIVPCWLSSLTTPRAGSMQASFLMKQAFRQCKWSVLNAWMEQGFAPPPSCQILLLFGGD